MPDKLKRMPRDKPMKKMPMKKMPKKGMPMRKGY